MLPRLDDYEADPKTVASYIGAAISIGIVIVLLNEARLTATLWAGAFLVLGTTTGFLFGIPRTVQGESGTPQLYVQKVNTNLEQISDWLTKILVGLGLTQLSKIPFTLQAAAAYIAEGMGNTPNQRVFVYALMIYFSFVGFIAGYLLTRIFLPRILMKAESGQAVITEAFALQAVVNPTSTTPDGPTSQRVARATDIVKVTKGILAAYEDLEKKDPGKNLETHIKELEPLMGDFPDLRMLYIVLARLYRWTGKLDTAINTLELFLRNKEKNGTRSDEDAGTGFYNLACYYAIRVEKSKTGEDKTKALENLSEAIKRVENYASQALLDTDFASLRDDDRFKSLTG